MVLKLINYNYSKFNYIQQIQRTYMKNVEIKIVLVQIDKQVSVTV